MKLIIDKYTTFKGSDGVKTLLSAQKNIAVADDIPEDYYKGLYVRPGATIRCTTVRELADETSPVTFTVGDYVTDKKLEQITERLSALFVY